MYQLIRDIVLSKDFFPSVIIAFSIISGLRYAADGDIGRAVYWLAGATLTAAVTFWIK